MVWISLFFLTIISGAAERQPKFLTKHAIETLRYISMNGRYAYVQKGPGVLGLVSNFRSVDFLSDSSFSDFIVTDSRFKERLAIEVVPFMHTEFSLVKGHKIYVVDWGNSRTKEVGEGRAPRLHLQDEWISYYDSYGKVIHIQNLETQKQYKVRPSRKANPFFIPEVEMVSATTVVYTDVNEEGQAALISYDLVSGKGKIIYKATQTGTKLELCQGKGHLVIGEFPYEGVTRGSQILQIKITGSTNLAGHSTVYNSVAQDLGNILCHENSVYFIKTVGQNKKLNSKITEAARLDLKTQKVDVLTSMNSVSQLIKMDGRILIPHRGEFYVLEGKSDLGEDTLKKAPNSKEELPLEI